MRKKDHFNTWEREKAKEMIVVSFSTSTWERKSFLHERKRHDCFFSCCCFHMGQRIVFHNEKEMDCFFFFIIFACHMMKHRICFPEWKKEMDCFHVNERRDGSLLFFFCSTMKERERWIASSSSSSSTWRKGLQVSHERHDSFFCFHMRPRICFSHESLKYKILLFMLQINEQIRAMWKWQCENMETSK